MGKRSRENEGKCLELVKNLFGRPLYCDADRQSISKILNSAYANPNSSVFPDFFCDEGFVEHFEVAPSEEKKKIGSFFRRDESAAKRVAEAEFDNYKKDLEKNKPNSNSISAVVARQCFNKFSYLNFLSSLKRNVQSHLEHAEKQGNLDWKNAAFLVEQVGGKLCIYDHNQFAGFYMLHSDRRALEILKACTPLIRFFFFVSVDSLEILDLSKIDDLLRNSSDDLDVRVGRLHKIEAKLFLDL